MSTLTINDFPHEALCGGCLDLYNPRAEHEKPGRKKQPWPAILAK